MKKTCRTCCEEKDVSEFYIDRKRKDEHKNKCKKCVNKQQRKGYEKNKESIKLKSKKYREENKDKIQKTKKACFCCKEEKELSEFRKRADRKYGYLSYCKACVKIKRKKIYDKNSEKAKEYAKNWTLNNKEIKKEIDKKYQKKHKEEINKNTRKWKKNNPEKVKAYIKRWKNNNPERIKELSRKRRENPQYRIESKISNGIYNAMKKRSSSKKGRFSFNNILPYSAEDLLCHLESLFEEGMTWENHGQGKGKWQIDHVIPDSWFKYTSVDDDGFKKSWALENLQPMWAKENLSKNNRYAGKYKGDMINA